jgi:hypothetical protein
MLLEGRGPRRWARVAVGVGVLALSEAVEVEVDIEVAAELARASAPWSLARGLHRVNLPW